MSSGGLSPALNDLSVRICGVPRKIWAWSRGGGDRVWGVGGGGGCLLCFLNAQSLFEEEARLVHVEHLGNGTRLQPAQC